MRESWGFASHRGENGLKYFHLLHWKCSPALDSGGVLGLTSPCCTSGFCFHVFWKDYVQGWPNCAGLFPFSAGGCWWGMLTWLAGRLSKAPWVCRKPLRTLVFTHINFISYILVHDIQGIHNPVLDIYSKKDENCDHVCK